MREIVHIQAGQCGNQIGAKVSYFFNKNLKYVRILLNWQFGQSDQRARLNKKKKDFLIKWIDYPRVSFNLQI